MIPHENSSAKFHCKECHYFTCRKSQYEQHLLTRKHQILHDPYIKSFKTIKSYECECGKAYKHSSSYYAHRKACFHIPKKDVHKEENETMIHGMSKDDLIIMLLKQNAELIKGQQDMTMELIKNGTHNTTTIHTNSHNKAFNLNVFLNETCKHAMNITEFVESIQLQLADFMEVGEVGYVQGISNIIVRKLNDLDETVRPIHCTDQKRETFYVKDEDKWEREEQDMKHVRKLVKKVAFKNERLMSTFKETYPDYKDSTSKRSDQYSKTVIEALGGNNTESSIEKENKIIRNISKATQIKVKTTCP